MALTTNSFKCLCPSCGSSYSLPVGARGRSTCLKCGKRFLVSDLEAEVDSFRQTYRACEIINIAQKYEYSTYKLDHAAVQSLMGSSCDLGSEVYAYAWLKSDADAISLIVSGKTIGVPNNSVTSNFLNPSTYSSSPFENGPCVMRTACKMVVTALKPKLKTKVTFCLFERPDVATEQEVASVDAISEINQLRGTFSQDFEAFKNVTIDDCILFFNNDGDLSDVIRFQSRSNPVGPVYFWNYEQFNLRKQCEWRSNNGRYRVLFVFRYRELEIKKVFFSDTPEPPEVHWISEAPPKLQRKFEGTRRIPLVWKQWGRTASFKLSADGQHVPVELYSTDYCHFWSDLIVFEVVDNQGKQELVYGANQALKPVFDSLRKCDEVLLVREPDNSFDPNAIKVVTGEGAKIGYLRSALSKVIGNVTSNVIALIDEPREFDVKILFCVARQSPDREAFQEYAKRVFDAYPDPSW